MGLFSKNKRSNRRRQSNMKRQRGGQKRPTERAAKLAGATRRAGERALPWVGLLLIAVLLPLGIFKGYMYAVSSPNFSVTRIELDGATYSNHKALLLKTNIGAGMNIFHVDEALAEQQIAHYDWVKHVTVKKSLPGTVSISVVEHTPVALVLDGRSYGLVDDQGEVFKRLDLAQDGPRIVDLIDTLPFVTGIPLDDQGADDESGLRIKEGLGIWRVYASMGLDELAQLSEVHYDTVLGYSLILGQQGTEVRLGRGRYRGRLERFAIVYQSYLDQGKPIDYILIDQREHIDRVAVGPTRTN